MKRIILTLAIITGFLLFSCRENKKTINQATNSIEATADQIVKNSVTSREGVKLDMTYNNTKRTASFVYQGETIELKQDTTASGIKYSNSRYEFTEWHGEIRLKKDGKVIFSKLPGER